MLGSESVPEVMEKGPGFPPQVLNVPLKPSYTNPNLSRIWKMNEEQKSAGDAKSLGEVTKRKNKSLNNRLQGGSGKHWEILAHSLLVLKPT